MSKKETESQIKCAKISNFVLLYEQTITDTVIQASKATLLILIHFIWDKKFK